MPTEILISPGTPGSPFSAITGAEALEPPKKGQSMFSSALPPLTSDAENISLQSYNLNMNGSDRVNKTLFGENSVTAYDTTIAPTLSPTHSSAETILNAYENPIEKELKRVKQSKTFLSKSQRFQDLVDWAFEVVDIDGSGEVGPKELYSGLLLIHLKLAAYVGPAACRPATREYVMQIFSLMDNDDNGVLDREEFGMVMALLCSQIVSRVFVQLGATLLIVPLVAQYVLDFCEDLAWLMQVIFIRVDDADDLSDRFWGYAMSVLDFILPAGIKNCLAFVVNMFLEIVPDEFVRSLPLTMISCILGILFVPWVLYNVDSYFTSLATRNYQLKKSQIIR